MLHFSKYKHHERDLYFERGKIYDNTIYTFDIESTSIVLFNNQVYDQDFYEILTEKEKKNARVYGFMYIWQFSINDQVYYGRTWEDFKKFFSKVFKDKNINTYIYVHNLSMETQFLRGILHIDNVFARQKYKPIYFQTKNIQWRCSYYLTQAKLADLPRLYNLPVEKLSGDLDYKKIRHSDTTLTDTEKAYCEHDCLVLYELIKHFLQDYKKIKNIPLTKTGILRRKVKLEMKKSKSFGCKMRDLINNDKDFFNAEVRTFSGGYTHANFYYSDIVLEGDTEITPFDICSSYPYIMCCEPVFPQQAFREFRHTPLDSMQQNFIYILHIKITNLKSIKQNTILSLSKCFNVSRDHVTDNGRLLTCASCETWITNFDYEMLKKFYEFDCELVQMYGAPAGYLPVDYIKFILEIYEKKTTLKNVEGKEQEYARAKSDFNSLFGMTCTNTIRDEVIYKNGLWDMHELTNEEITEKLEKESKKLFLNFSYGIFVCSKARYNLLSAVAQLDEYNAYSDTDSLKLVKGFPRGVINRYNINVLKTIKKAKENTGLKGFIQYDIKGYAHVLGILEEEKDVYKRFKVLGAKKYCREDEKGKLHITVAGVPKSGSKSLKSIFDFKDDFVFRAKDTDKLQLFYNEEKDISLTVRDYMGQKKDISFSYGIGFVPCTYTLKQSSIFQEFNDMWIERRLFK